MRVLQDAQARNLPSLLERLSRATGHVLLKAHRVPDLDRTVFRARGEKEVIGRDLDRRDGGSVFDEMGDERPVGPIRDSFTGGDGTKSSSARNSRRDSGP